MSNWCFNTRFLLLLLLGLFVAVLGQTETVLSVPFDGTTNCDGSGGYTQSRTTQMRYVPGRLNSALALTKEDSPLIFIGGKAALSTQGCLSFWLGSLDLHGQDKTAVNLVNLKQGAFSIKIFKAGDAYLTAILQKNDQTSPVIYRYPIYDLQPNYPDTAGKGTWDIHHFIFFQWGTKDEGLYVNGIPASSAQLKIANTPGVLATDGQLVLGDKSAGIYLDELVLQNTTKSSREILDNFLSYLTGSYSLPLPQITITEHRGAPITIDGNLTDIEWKDASELSGLHEMGSRRILPYEASYFFTYDKDKFYIGMKTFADYPLISSEGTREKRGEDFMICMEDCIEVLLMPYESIRYDYYHFLANSSGYFVDQLGTNTNWDGKWEYKSQVKNGVWTAEIAIPYSSLSNDSEKAQYPKGDGMWRFNVTRNWDGVLDQHWAPLCYCGNYGDFGKFALMSFEKDGISPRFQGMTTEKDGLAFTFDIVNNGTQTRKLSASAFAVSKILPFSEVKEAVELKGGERKTVTLHLPTKNVNSASIEWGITDIETAKFLYRGSGVYPVYPGIADEYKQSLIDNARIAKEAVENSTPKNTGSQPTEEKKPAPVLWPTPNALDDALTKRLQWKNNDLGYSEQVPPPWTAMTEKDGEIGVWGRSYSVKNALILGNVKVQGQNMLAGPVALVLEKNGKQTRYEKATTTVTSVKSTRVEFVAVGGDKSLTISTRSYIEFDGCMWVEMKLQPHTPISFDKMWLEIPYQANEVTNYNYWIDKESGARCGQLTAAPISETYRPYVWLGSPNRGLCWFNEEYREWFIEEPEKTQMTFIEPGKGQRPAYVKIMMAVTPNTLSAPMSTEFGLMATPVKPMPKNWRLYDFYCGWSKLKGQFSDWGTGYFVKEPADPQDFVRRLAAYDKQSPYILATPNCGSFFFTETNYSDGRMLPDYWLWGNEFSQGYNPTTKVTHFPWVAPTDPNFRAGGYTTAIPNREYTDLYLFNYHKLMTDYPLLKGVYMDSCIPVGNNKLNDSGYIDRYGKQRGTIEIMNSRQFNKRLYTMFWQLRGNPDEHPWVIYNHCSNQICPPIHAFATSVLQGEGLSAGPRAFGDHPLNALPMGAMEVGYNSHAYGWIEQFLGLYTANPETCNELTTMFFMHDHNVMGRGDARTGTRFATVLQRAGLIAPDDALTFIPYWDNKGAVRSVTKNGYVNAYIKTKEQRTILVVASMDVTDAPTTITMQLNREKLALPAGTLTITDLYTGEQLPLIGNSITIPIRKNDYRAFEVK